MYKYKYKASTDPGTKVTGVVSRNSTAISAVFRDRKFEKFYILPVQGKNAFKPRESFLPIISDGSKGKRA